MDQPTKHCPALSSERFDRLCIRLAAQQSQSLAASFAHPLGRAAIHARDDIAAAIRAGRV